MRQVADVRVATQNLYLGADIGTVLAATSPEEVPVLVAQAWQQAVANDFHRRAQAIAHAIVENDAQLVGLEEVALFRMQEPGDAAAGGTTPAVTVVSDYLDEILGALQARGQRYVVASTQTESDIELPMFAGVDASGQPLFNDLRFTDRDVILARVDVPTWHPEGGQFATKLTVPVAGANVDVVRGWTSVHAFAGGRAFRFVTAHLEEETAPPIQEAQASELRARLDGEPLPIILVGDFNSAADGTQTATYQQMLNAGFIDVWQVDHRRDPGYSCCQAADLRNTTSTLEHRIDFVFFHEECVARPGSRLRRVEAKRIDATPISDAGDQAPRWASDHAGFFASFGFRPH